eukprot:3700993-Alexandrium_andersonii.AAC.1
MLRTRCAPIVAARSQLVLGASPPADSTLRPSTPAATADSEMDVAAVAAGTRGHCGCPVAACVLVALAAAVAR